MVQAVLSPKLELVFVSLSSFSQKHLFNLSKNAFILWNTKKGGLHRPEVLGGPSKSNFGKIWLKLDEPLPPRDPQ